MFEAHNKGKGIDDVAEESLKLSLPKLLSKEWVVVAEVIELSDAPFLYPSEPFDWCQSMQPLIFELLDNKALSSWVQMRGVLACGEEVGGDDL